MIRTRYIAVLKEGFPIKRFYCILLLQVLPHREANVCHLRVCVVQRSVLRPSAHHHALGSGEVQHRQPSQDLPDGDRCPGFLCPRYK